MESRVSISLIAHHIINFIWCISWFNVDHNQDRVYCSPLKSQGVLITNGDENHLCRASLRKSHKISLKAHRHACVHGVGTLVARPEKLP